MLNRPLSPPVVSTELMLRKSEKEVPFQRRINPSCWAINILVLPLAGLALGGIAISIGLVSPVVAIGAKVICPRALKEREESNAAIKAVYNLVIRLV